MAVDPQQFRTVVGRFATGVTVVTTDFNGQRRGMTANSFCSVSMEPALIQINVDRRAEMHALLMSADSFCVNILPEHRRDWSDWWAGKAPKGVDQFADIPFHTKSTGSPILEDILGYLDCTIWNRYDGGDHTMFIGEVVDAHLVLDMESRPLLFYGSKYQTIGDPL